MEFYLVLYLWQQMFQHNFKKIPVIDFK